MHKNFVNIMLSNKNMGSVEKPRVPPHVGKCFTHDSMKQGCFRGDSYPKQKVVFDECLDSHSSVKAYAITFYSLFPHHIHDDGCT